MPTYQYACRACGEALEAVQSFSDPSLTECPSCAGELRKVFSAVGVVFKGSGFYKTDSRKTGSSSEGASEKKAEAAPATAKSESAATPAASAPAAAPSTSSAPAAAAAS